MEILYFCSFLQYLQVIMAAYTRMLRRDFTGKISLKTTDCCTSKSLLAKFTPSSTRILTNGKKLQDGLYLCELENVLSPQECNEVITNGDESIFLCMSEKYRYGKQRNSSRLLVLDKTLAGNLWQNIESVLSREIEELKLSKQPLGFDVRRGEWELHGLNEGMRINKYMSQNKEYFGPHKDGQYCPSGDQRSLFTLLVYLNEGFHGGETCFYFPKDSTPNTKGMTIKQEITAHGGLVKGFDCLKVVPKVGHAVLFSQNILHESLPILGGTKYVLKTDVVVKRHSKQFGFAVEDEEKDDYLACLNYFREAQQQELKRNFQDASDLYERALSVRYCYPESLESTSDGRVTSEDNDQKKNAYMMLPHEVWPQIFKYLPGYDAQNLVYAFPELNTEKKRWERFEMNSGRPVFSQKYLPKVNYQKGIVTCFEFPDADYFRENVDGCCRVAAMYSFFLLGHKPEDDVYTVRYNPNTQEVCAVALETLLTDIFYNRRCYGSFYNVGQQDPEEKDPEKDFEASVDRNYMMLRHGAQFVGKEVPDSFCLKTSVIYTYEHMASEPISRYKVRSQEPVVKDPEKIPFYIEVDMPGRREGDNPLSRLLESNLESATSASEVKEDLLQTIVDTEEKAPGDVAFCNALQHIVASENVSCALVSKAKEPLTIESDSICFCGMDEEHELGNYIGDSCTTKFYNHLIFDFQAAQLSVQYVDEVEVSRGVSLHHDHFARIAREKDLTSGDGKAMVFNVNIEPVLSSGTGFNHASCQCGHPEIDVHDYCNLKDYPYLNHINLVAREKDGRMLVWTVYGGIVAL